MYCYAATMRRRYRSATVPVRWALRAEHRIATLIAPSSLPLQGHSNARRQSHFPYERLFGLRTLNCLTETMYDRIILRMNRIANRDQLLANALPIRVGMVGMGNWAQHGHVRVLNLLPEYELSVLYSQRAEAAAAVAAK